jgi:hypothetical protein
MEEFLMQFNDLAINRIKGFEEPFVILYYEDDSVIIEYWDACRYDKSWKIKFQNCHISDEACEEYFRGLALFLNEINPYIRVCNLFFYGVCYDEENDEIYYDEEQYMEELIIPFAFEVVFEMEEEFIYENNDEEYDDFDEYDEDEDDWDSDDEDDWLDDDDK